MKNRAFVFDALRCPPFPRTMPILATITGPATERCILEHLGGWQMAETHKIDFYTYDDVVRWLELLVRDVEKL